MKIENPQLQSSECLRHDRPIRTVYQGTDLEIPMRSACDRPAEFAESAQFSSASFLTFEDVLAIRR
jgi:hypothetical protein